MKITRIQIAIFTLVIYSFLFSAVLYSQLPDQMASHWNASGNVDGYMPKATGAFLMPVILAATVLLLQALVLVDPLKANIKKFRQYYDGTILATALFMVLVHTWMLLWNVGIKVNVNVIMSIGIGALFFFLGFILPNFKRNWFMGIRTPWTITNEFVWTKTHEHCRKIFMFSGLIAICGSFAGDHAFLFIFIAAIVALIYSVIYSYLVYRSLPKDYLDHMPSSGDTNWDNLKDGYLYQVENALQKVRHPGKKEVLKDVSSHLDQRYSELKPDQKNWENFQQIITEMGPAQEYAELLGNGSANISKFTTKSFIIFLLVNIVTVAIIIGIIVVSSTSNNSGGGINEVGLEKDPELVDAQSSSYSAGNGDIVLDKLTILPRGDEYIIVAKIINKGEIKTPEFDVFFYNTKPDQTSPATHKAGPIESAGHWNASSLPFKLKQGQNEFTVIIDPKNVLKETDETNNQMTLVADYDDGKIISVTTKSSK